jgi:pimeloyl-ACP methyl ester carboxylesterase
VGSFAYEGFTLAYEARGPHGAHAGKPLVLVHALLFSRKHLGPLADALTERGNRVILLDLLGHGESDRPADARHYSVESFAEQVLALMDHLEIDEAVIGGTSLGATVTLEVTARRPARVRGMFLEMPALEKSSVALALFFLPLATVLSRGGRALKAATRAAASLPRGASVHVEVLFDALAQNPEAAGAVIQGLFHGRLAPYPSEREKMDAPSLIVGHMHDRLHPFSDAENLHRQLRNSELLRGKSFFELRFPPNRLSDRFAEWLDEVWS